MNRVSVRRSCKSLLLKVMVLSVMTSSAACANNHEKNPAAAAEADESAVLLESKLTVKNNIATVNRPRLLVKFEPKDPADPGSILCPTGTAFKVNVAGTWITLPTGVPTSAAPINDPVNQIVWVAADGNYDELPGLKDFHFGVFFHPFQDTNNSRYRSRSVRVGGSTYQVVGPLNMRSRRLLPGGVEYKYTIARIEQVDIGGKQRWTIMDGDTGCKPLDPLIRVY